MEMCTWFPEWLVVGAKFGSTRLSEQAAIRYVHTLWMPEQSRRALASSSASEEPVVADQLIHRVPSRCYFFLACFILHSVGVKEIR